MFMTKLTYKSAIKFLNKPRFDKYANITAAANTKLIIALMHISISDAKAMTNKSPS